MTWYYYLNYRIYKYYQKKRDSMPVLFSYLGTVLLLFMNICSVFGLIGFYYPLKAHISKLHILGLMLLLVVFNYIVLYRGKYYTEVFDRFDNESEMYKSWNKYVPIYIIASILFMLVILGIADYQHDGHF